jgi:hypothetical protein
MRCGHSWRKLVQGAACRSDRALKLAEMGILVVGATLATISPGQTDWGFNQLIEELVLRRWPDKLHRLSQVNARPT